MTQVEDPPRTPTPQGRRSTPSEPFQQPQEAEVGTENATGDGLSSTSHALPETQLVGDQHAVNIDSDRSSMPDLDTIQIRNLRTQKIPTTTVRYFFTSLPRTELN